MTTPGDEEYYRAAIGPINTEYYLRRFARFDAGESSVSWLWPALFVAFYWLIYRKMAWWALLYVAVIYAGAWIIGLLVGIAGALAGVPPPRVQTTAAIVAWLVTGLLPPMFATAFYYWRVRRRIATAVATHPTRDAQLAWLVAKGGTTKTWWIWAIVLGIFLVGVIAGIAIPAYQDYITRAKVSEVLIDVEPLKREVELSWNQHGAIPSELDLAQLHQAAGATYIKDVRFDSRTGALTIIFSAFDPRLEGKSFRWVPSGQPGGQILWSCKNVDVPARLLPAHCRN